RTPARAPAGCPHSTGPVQGQRTQRPSSEHPEVACRSSPLSVRANVPALNEYVKMLHAFVPPRPLGTAYSARGGKPSAAPAWWWCAEIGWWWWESFMAPTRAFPGWWCINCVDHPHSLERISMASRGSATKLTRYQLLDAYK